MKNVITAAIFVAVTATSAFAGEKAQNLIDPVQVKIASLETQVSGLATVATSLAVQLREALDNSADPVEIEELNAQLADANEAADELEDELNTVKNNWWHTKQNVIRLSNENNDLKYAADQASDLIADLQEELEDVYNDLDTAYEDMDDLDETILDLQAHNQDDQITALTNIISQADAEALDMAAEINELNDTIDGYQGQLVEFETQAGIWFDEQDEVLAAKDAEIANLQDQLSEANDTITAYDTAIEDIADIISEGGDDVLNEVLSFINGLDLNI